MSPESRALHTRGLNTVTEQADFTAHSGGRRRGRGLLAGLAAIAVAGSGLLGASLPAAAEDAGPAPSAAACVPLNPMGGATPHGSESGYTLFVSGDAIIANSELEGTLAVGGEARFGDPRGQQGPMYPILHGGAGGNADYAVPTIGGEPNRVLIERFGLGSKVVQVKTQGGTAEAGVKIGDRSVPADHTLAPAFGHSGTTFFPASGGNQSPQIDSQAQRWTTLAEAEQSWGISGTVLDEFPADVGASTIAAFTDWKPALPPAGAEPTITFLTDGPIRLPLAAFEETNKFHLEGYSESSFLVVQASPSDVSDGRITLPSYAYAGNDSPRNEGISHILFDLSELSGEIEVFGTAESVRGSIYAPNAHIVFPERDRGGQQFEGQLIAQQLTALQGSYELHTNLFAGRFPCSDEPAGPEGTFTLEKKLAGIEADNFPEGTTFPVTATWDGGTQEFGLPADGTPVPAGVTLPEGTVVTLTEGELPESPAGYRFVSNELSADTITILADSVSDIAWSVTNTYASIPADPKGTFTLEKKLAGGGISPESFPEGTTVSVTASWDGGSQTFELPVEGTVVASGLSLPAGTRVSLSEVRLPDTPPGYRFVSSISSADTITIREGGNENISWSVTNTYQPPVPIDEGTFTLRKDLAGIGADDFPEGTTFPVTATWNGGTQEFELPADGSPVEAGRTLPAGTVVTLTEGELPESPAGYRFVSNELSADTITILADSVYDISWSVTNTYAEVPDVPGTRTGGFDLRKALSGAVPGDFPAGTDFTVVATWTQDDARVSREYRLPVDGGIVQGARGIPAGTVVSFEEVRVPSADGRSFVEAEFSEAKLTVEADAVTAVTVTNTYRTPKLAASGAGGTAAVMGGAALLLLAGGAALLLRRRRIG